MSLSFIGPSGSYEVPWIRYALLRDNVLRHLDKDSYSPAFGALYRIGHALGGTEVRLSAVQLQEEAGRAHAGLAELPISELAISARTKAIIELETMLPAGPPTYIVGPTALAAWVASDAVTLADAFKAITQALLAITANAQHGDIVEVYDT
ncbi:MAG TPA: hypothetical protein PLW65_12935 [Pseudomonadota bacterium]|nr:hypothetical protein [Pseudomonadota bacterium]